MESDSLREGYFLNLIGCFVDGTFILKHMKSMAWEASDLFCISPVKEELFTTHLLQNWLVSARGDHKVTSHT